MNSKPKDLKKKITNLLIEQAMTIMELARESFCTEEEILKVLDKIDKLEFYECELGKVYYLEVDDG